MHTLAEEIDKRLAGSKPDKNDVEKKVFEVICQQLGYVESELKLETNVKLEIGADSLDIIELSIALEEEFGTEIEDSELEKWDTVSAFVEGVYELVVNK
ncbi:MAG: acyl carrier protein [bacterium]|nr:acyl carrier protein [bacterium]